jgi:hypothetical protein
MRAFVRLLAGLWRKPALAAPEDYDSGVADPREAWLVRERERLERARNDESK